MVHRVVKDSCELYIQILGCFIKPCYLKGPVSEVVKLDPKNQAYHLLATKIYGGIKFARLMETTASKRDMQSTNQMFERLLQFLVELAVQLQQRLPLSDTTLSDVCTLLDPEEIVRGSNMSLANITAKIPGVVRAEDEQKLDDEWRLQILSDEAKNILSQNADIDIESFWSKVSHTGKYPLVSKLAKAFLTIPVSNADCERIFSLVTLKKTNKRNKLKNTTLANEIVSGEGIRQSQCIKFEPSGAMLKAMVKNIFPQWHNDDP